MRSGLEFVGIAAAYLAIAESSLWIPWINPFNAPAWPPTGFALALVVFRGRHVWPAIVIGCFGASTLAGHAYWPSALISIGVVAAALGGDLLLRLWAKDAARDALATPVQVARFGAVCAIASVMMSVILAFASAVPFGTNAFAGSAAAWMNWGLVDAGGSILIAPAMVLWPRTDASKLRYLETALLSVVAGAIAIAAFAPWLPLSFAVSDALQKGRSVLAFFVAAPLAWAALRGDKRSAITAAVCFVGAACFSLSGVPSLSLETDLNEHILFMFALAVCTSVPTLLLAAAVSDRQRRESDLLIAQQKLVRDVEQTQTALEFAERHFRLLMEHVTDYAIFLLDTAGRVASWNGAAQRIVGYAPTEIIGSQFSTFYRPDDRRAGEPIRALELAVQNDSADVEGWWLKKNGEPFFVTGRISTIRNEKGELVGFSSVMRDATERRDAEEKLVEAREQLAMAQKMEAIGKLTGGIAHDFNNLLMIIGGNAQTFKRLLDPKLPRAIEAIQTAAKRGETLTRQLLTFSRRQHLSPTVVDLGTIIRNMRPMIESSLRGNIVYNENLRADVFAAKVDVSELQLAIVNIAVNARDAMPNGGTFTLSMANVAPDDLVGGLHPGDFIGVTFQDSGTGIPPNLLSKIFDPFFTTKEVGKGTGLGLSQVYGFAHQAGGTVRAESKVGEGTAITLYLPLCSEEQASDAEVSVLDATLAKRPKVLVVDDSADVAEVTSSLFESLGYQPIYRDSAEAALKLLAEGGRFDLVFSDIVMPGNIDGVGLANEIRVRYPQVPIILTTGYSEVAQTIPPDLPLLRKPFGTDELRSSVQDALRSSPALH